MRLLTRSYYLGTGGVRVLSKRFGTTIEASIENSSNAALQNSDCKITDFVRRASILKNRFRGKAQYEFARNEACRFLESEVPKINVNAWLEQTCNAIAFSQILRFFEVQPDMEMISLLLNKLVRTVEDAKASPVERMEATLALMRIRPEENYERSFATVEVILKVHYDNLSGKAADEKCEEQRTAWRVLDLCAKVLQQCGKRVPISLNDRLSKAVLMLLQTTKEQDLVSLEFSLLRIYAWMVHAEREEARNILDVIAHVPLGLKSYDFATLMESCGRHHRFQPLPIGLIKWLVCTSLEYSLSSNGKDTSIILNGIANIISTLQPDINEVMEKDVKSLYDNFTALLEEYHPLVLRFMDEKDELYWKHPGDVTTIVFSYELSGCLRQCPIFDRYTNYLTTELSALEPTPLAMATGILRRADRLTHNMATRLSERIEALIGEMKLSELSYICATFASLPTTPKWLYEARAVALRLLSPEATGLTRLNLAIAFPDDSNFVSQVNYSQMFGSQLVDILPMVLGNAVFEGPVVAALVTHLREAKERFSPNDARVLLNCGRPVLVNAINYYLYQRLNEPKWDTSILYCLPLVSNKGGSAQDPSRALEAAKQASTSPEQFDSLVELLSSVFGESDVNINTFVKVGGKNLLMVHRVSLRSVVRYLAAVRPFPSLHPDSKWLDLLTEKMATRFSPLRPDELESLLISLRTIYTDVNKTPVLHMLLSDVVENYYIKDFNESTVQAARITVLLVHMQRGMSLPLLTDQTPPVKAVKQNCAGYPEDVKEVIASMPLPTSTDTKVNSGRFTLKSIPTGQSHKAPVAGHGSDAVDSSLHQNPSITSGLGEVVKHHEKVEGGHAADLGDITTGTTLPRAESQPESNVTATSPVVLAPSGIANEPPHTSHAEEGPTSYYAKFFSSSVGQIFRGHNRDETPSEGNQLQPSYTNPQAHINNQKMLGTPQMTSFGSLFANAEAWPTTPPTTEGAPQQGESSVMRSPCPVGNPIYHNPSAQQRNRPVITKTAVVGRVGKSTDPSVPIERGMYSAAAQESQGATPGAYPAVPADVVLVASATPQAKAGSVDFLQRAGLAKVSGYNMDNSEASHIQRPNQTLPVESPMVPAKSDTSGNPLAWQEAARRVARISRHVKTKDKTRGQQSLSEWLSAPAKRLNDTKAIPTTVVPTPQDKKKKGGKAGIQSKQSHGASEGNRGVGSIGGNAHRKAVATTTGAARSRGGRGSAASAKTKAQAPAAKASTKKISPTSSPRKATAAAGRKTPSEPAPRRGGNAAAKAALTKKATPAKKVAPAKKATPTKKAADKKPSPRKETPVRQNTKGKKK
ncbi:unnamed protein product [Phytomonas sp. Hart1]|nr:unnamed protein product [Phytomonas sp. Hart1]|eukprot:CCW70993.1 unnamed protein product [Phytomonas sp. isolate Hart1]